MNASPIGGPPADNAPEVGLNRGQICSTEAPCCRVDLCVPGFHLCFPPGSEESLASRRSAQGATELTRIPRAIPSATVMQQVRTVLVRWGPEHDFKNLPRPCEIHLAFCTQVSMSHPERIDAARFVFRGVNKNAKLLTASWSIRRRHAAKMLTFRSCTDGLCVPTAGSSKCKARRRRAVFRYLCGLEVPGARPKMQ